MRERLAKRAPARAWPCAAASHPSGHTPTHVDPVHRPWCDMRGPQSGMVQRIITRPRGRLVVNTGSVSHLNDAVLRRELAAIVHQDRITTVRLLAHMAEFAGRRLYREDGYPSMFAYCTSALRMSEDVAYKRIRAARAGRRFPGVFAGIADGSLTLSAVVLLAPHLTQGTAQGLLAAAAGKTNAQVQQILAERFPQPNLPTRVVAIESPAQLAVRPVVESADLTPRPIALSVDVSTTAEGPREPATPVQPTAPGISWPKVAPLSPQGYAVQFTMSEGMHEKLERAKNLLGHQIPSGDLPQVLERALDALIAQLEKRKFGATDKPRDGLRRESQDPRHIPAAIRRAVTARDRGRCTFVSDSGHRCEARKMLEFDHVLEVARGGRATVDNLRLRCRAHNQLAAEKTFGVDWMKGKREDATRVRSRIAATSTAMEARSRSCRFGQGLRPLP